MELYFYDYIAEIGEDEILCAKICAMHYQYAMEYSERLEKSYKQASDLGGVVSSISNQAYRYIYQVIQSEIQLLNDLGVYCIDEKMLLQYHKLNIEKFELAFQEVEEAYLECVQIKKDSVQYRELRKQSRGKLIGGGFGLDGAIKGIATAGAINATTGLAHSAFNMIDGAITNAAIRKTLKDLKGDVKMRQKVINGFKEDIISLIDGFYSALRDYTDYIQLYNKDSVARANVMAKNLLSNKVANQHLHKVMFEMILEAPFIIDHYHLIYNILGEGEEELDHIASIFDIELNLTRSRESKERVENLFDRSKEELDQKFEHNSIYEKNEDIFDVDSMQELAQVCWNSFNTYSKRKGVRYILDKNFKSDRYYLEALKAYGHFDQKKETPLFIFEDNLSSGKKGIIVTDCGLYIPKYFLPWNKIYRITYGEFNDEILINDFKIRGISKDDRYDIICTLKILWEYGKACISKTRENAIKNNGVDEIVISKEYINELLGYLNIKKLESKIYVYGIDVNIETKIEKLMKNSVKLLPGEKKLCCYYLSGGSYIITGILLTNKGIYKFNGEKKAEYIPYDDIMKFSLGGLISKTICINHIELTLLNNQETIALFNLVNRVYDDYKKGVIGYIQEYSNNLHEIEEKFDEVVECSIEINTLYERFVLSLTALQEALINKTEQGLKKLAEVEKTKVEEIEELIEEVKEIEEPVKEIEELIEEVKEIEELVEEIEEPIEEVKEPIEEVKEPIEEIKELIKEVQVNQEELYTEIKLEKANNYNGKVKEAPIIKKENRFKCIIPGFRTNKWWKKIMGVLIYIILGMLFINIFKIQYPETYSATKVISYRITVILMYVLFLVIPFLILADGFNLKEKNEFCKKHPILFRPVLLLGELAISFIILIIITMIS